MGLLAALDTACLLTPRAWATSARERVVSISRMAAVRTAARSLALFLEGVLQADQQGLIWWVTAW